MKAGLRERWTPLGHTVLYGEYEKSNDGGAVGRLWHHRARARRHDRRVDFELWGLGVVQEIDAAAMSVWLSYRNIEGDDDDANGASSNFDDFQYVKAGALINF